MINFRLRELTGDKIGKSLSGHQFLAAGDDEGTLHILEIPKNLIKPMRNEVSIRQ